MNILIYDNNPADLSKLCDMLEMLPIDLFVDKISNFDDGMSLYAKNNYELVFIDFQDDIGEKLLTSILEKNPLQRVVTISDIERSSEKNGCNYCINIYNKKRLTKPINQDDLVNVFVKKERCVLYCNNGLLLQLEKISKELKSIQFDKKTFTFMKNSDTTSHRNISDMIHLVHRLNEENIHFESVDNGIKILSDTK